MIRRRMTLIEILIVVMLMTTGIIPIYSLMSSGRKRVTRAEERTLSTIVAASVLELYRTNGYEEADRLKFSPDFQKILSEARENHLEIGVEVLKVVDEKEKAETLSGHACPIKQVIVTVRDEIRGQGKKNRDTVLTTLLVDPRDALY